MVSVEFKEDGMEIDLHGLEKLAAMKEKLFVPYENITAVDDSVGDLRITWKVAGSGFGQNYDYGRFETNEGYGFYVMRKRDDAFVIHLANFKYRFIVLDLDNRQEVIDELRSHIVSTADDGFHSV